MRHIKFSRAAAAFLACFLLAAGTASVKAAENEGTVLLADEKIADGVRYSEEDIRNYTGKKGYRLRLNQLEIDPSAPGLQILSGKAEGTVNATETVLSQAQDEIAEGRQVVAGINADSFDVTYGSNRGILIKDGCILTSQPYNEYTEKQPAFYVDSGKKAHIGPLRVGGDIQIGDSYHAETDFVNRNHFTGSAGYQSPRNSNRLYTSSLTSDHTVVNGAGTPPSEQAYALILLEGYNGKLKIGTSYQGKVLEVHTEAGFYIPENCVVYSGYGTKAAAIKLLSPGMDVSLTYHLYTGDYTQDWDGALMERGTLADNVVTAVNSFQLLAKDGSLNHSVTDTTGTDKKARTVIGLSRDGVIHIVTAAEDGPDFKESDGTTMKDIAEYMMSRFQCTDVLNMDGGGSAEMVARRVETGILSTVSYPSDGKSRKVSDSLLFASSGKLPDRHSYVSDTTADLTVDDAYTFRILCSRKPSFQLGTPFVFQSELTRQEGNSYFYRVTPVGLPGQQTGVYLNGESRLLKLTVGKHGKNAVLSDTTAPFSIKKGSQYQFKLTAGKKPVLKAGSPSFTVSFVRQSGHDWFFKVKAVGKSKEGCGFYINGIRTPVAVAEIL